MRYINVIGNSAVGKSTFSKALAEQLSLHYIELDNLFWKDNWQQSTDVEFFAKIQAQIDYCSDGWVMDGNYTRSIAIKWQQVDTVIWLDYPFTLNLYRSIHRAFHFSLTKRKLWQDSNNHETFRQLFSKDSVVLWMIKQHRLGRKKNQKILQNPEYQHVKVIRFQSPKQAEAFLEKVNL